MEPKSGGIDTHIHLWRYAPEEFGWISEEMIPLRRDFFPAQLKPLLDDAGIGGAIAVQARQSLEETDWLLDLAETTDCIRGVVGWAPLAGADFAERLTGLRVRNRLKGLRHVIQDEPDDEFMLRPDFNRGIEALRGTGLVYDILIHARHLEQALRFVDLHPEQPFVLDHCAKPPIAGSDISPENGTEAMKAWAEHMHELARRPNVCCKLSGLITEADWGNWTPENLEPVWRVVLEAFGPGRLLFGSDWPVALLAASYARWVEIVRAWTAPLTTDEQEAIWGGNARRVYRL